MNRDLQDIRKDYAFSSLTEADVLASPLQQLQRWLDEAIKAKMYEPTAMFLATANAEAMPSGRIVLLKGLDHGLVWYTNYDSHKGSDLAQNPNAAITFYWDVLERQVRITGRVERVSEAESDAYFKTRPIKSQIGAIVSQQSKPIADYQLLSNAFEAKEAELTKGYEPTRPGNWGGFRLIPSYFEFWQGRRSRLHDRITYTIQSDGNWKLGRLQP